MQPTQCLKFPENDGPPDANLAQILNELYDAALGDETKWGTALAKLRAEFNGTAAQIAGIDFARQCFELNIIEGEGIGLQAIENYEAASLKDLDNVIPHIKMNRALASNLHYKREFVEERIAAVKVPSKFAQYLALIIFEKPFWNFLTVMRPIDGVGFTLEDCRRFTASYSDLRRIFAIIRARKEIERDPSHAKAMLAIIDHPLAIANGNGEIIYFNPNADELLAGRDMTAFTKNVWKMAAQNATRNGTAEFVLNSIVIKVQRVDRAISSEALRVFDYSIANLLLSFEETQTLMPSSVKEFAKKYKLTNSEAEICRELKSGDNPSEIAKSRGRSLATIRTQIRSIREKTKCNNQVALLRLLVN